MEDASWVSWFCSSLKNDAFVQVSHYFLNDNFNLTGLSSKVPFYSLALSTIRDGDTSELSELTEDQELMVESSAEILYGLIHARYIITQSGITKMLKKYKAKKFGTCPRFLCEDQPCLPYGESDIPGESKLKVFCPRCQRIYVPRIKRHRKIDGAYFGSTFAHLALNMYKELRPKKPPFIYIPRIYGFKIDPATFYKRRAIKDEDGSRISEVNDEQSVGQ